MVVPFAILWLLLPGQYGGVVAPLGVILSKYATPTMVGRTLAGIAALVYLTWKFQVDGLCIELAGRRWVMWLGGLLIYSLGFCVWIPLISLEAPVIYHRILTCIPAALVILVTVKIVALIAVMSASVRADVLSPSELPPVAGKWLLAAVIASAFAAAVIPAATAPRWELVASVVLLMPGIRLAMAPLALAWNRHR